MSDGCLKDDVSEQRCKRLKIDNENGNNLNDNQLELKDFVLEKILNNNTNRKTACVVGKFKDKSGVALILFEKNAFKENDLSEEGYFSKETQLKTFFENDIYGNFECFPPSTINGNFYFIFQGF